MKENIQCHTYMQSLPLQTTAKYDQVFDPGVLKFQLRINLTEVLV